MSRLSTSFSNNSSSCQRERSIKSSPVFCITSEILRAPSLREFFNDIKGLDVLIAQLVDFSLGVIGNMFLILLNSMFLNVKVHANNFSLLVAGFNELSRKRSRAFSGVSTIIRFLIFELSIRHCFNFLAACFDGTTISIFPDSFDNSFFKKLFARSNSGLSQPRKYLRMLIVTFLTGFITQVNQAR